MQSDDIVTIDGDGIGPVVCQSAITVHMLKKPDCCDVIVAESMFGDIISDFGGTVSCRELTEAVCRCLS